MPENLHELVSQLIIDTKGTPAGGFWPWQWAADSSLAAFAPELMICATIVLMLALRLPRLTSWLDAFWVALIGSGLALVLAPWSHLLGPVPSAAQLAQPDTVARMEIFTGMLVHDTFGVYVRTVLLLFAVLFILFTRLSGIPHRSNAADIYTLVLGATLGMCLMASANHLLMVFLAVEMASVPCYALAGMMRGQRLASEAALKYSVYGAGAAGVMLYGISLIAGLLGTAHLPTMAMELARRLPEMAGAEKTVLVLGAVMMMVGLAFKLSAVPFHFWCPDVFEGATAEVNAFLSVASKAAALALLVRVMLGFGAVPPDSPRPGERTARLQHAAPAVAGAELGQAATALVVQPAAAVLASEEAPAEAHTRNEPVRPLAADEALQRLAPVRRFLARLVALLAVVTCTFGNLAAYGQTNLKRLMAYSTIAHAGYMMMAVPPLLALAGLDQRAAQGAAAALCIYIGVYLFMNLGAFAIIAFVRNAMGSEQIDDYAGLVRRCPVTSISLAIILFSLIGIPPLAGFVGKFAIFASLADGYRITAAAGDAATYLLVLLVVGCLNTVISLFYYLRVVKVMTLDPEPADRIPFTLSDPLQGTYVVFTAAAVIVLFFAWDPLNYMAQAAARYLLHLT